MIQIFYSNKEKNSDLLDTTKSLGGHISTNSFVNSRKSTFLPDLFDLEKIDCRLLILKNSSQSIINCSISLEYESNLVDYEYGLVLPYIDPCGDKVFETITNNSEPMYCSFIEGTTITNFSIESLNILGVWVKRQKKNTVDSNNLIQSSCSVEHLPIISDKIVENLNLKLIC